MSSRIPYCVTKKYSFTDETIWGHRRLFYPRSHVNQSMSWCNDGFLPYQEGWGWHGPMANCWSELCCRWGVREGNGLHKLRAVITRVHASSAGLCRQHASTHRYRDYLYMINWSRELRQLADSGELYMINGRACLLSMVFCRIWPLIKTSSPETASCQFFKVNCILSMLICRIWRTWTNGRYGGDRDVSPSHDVHARAVSMDEGEEVLKETDGTR